MEARRGTRSVMQQRIDPEPASEPLALPTGEASAAPAPIQPTPVLPALPQDSDTALWERRRQWHEERERFERFSNISSARIPPRPSPGSSSPERPEE